MDFTSGFPLLILTSISIAVIHTLSGPDHYIPFIVLSNERKWSAKKTTSIVLFCGIGHVISSVLLAFAGIWLQTSVLSISGLEEYRGSIASWILFLFGFAYLIWGIWKLIRQNSKHSHLHFHQNGIPHTHTHNHESSHVHIHLSPQKNITPWVLFIIFIFGPCEPMIPLIMGSQLQYGWNQTVLIILLFSAFTISSMMMMVFAGLYGFSKLKTEWVEKYTTVISGGALSLCGVGMIWLGL